MKLISKEWFFSLLRFSKLFGFMPYSHCVVYQKYVVQKAYAFIFVVILTLYWIGLFETLVKCETAPEKLSLVSNWIQLFVNGASLTVIVISPLINVKAFNDINRLFIHLDGKIDETGFKLNTRKINFIMVANIVFFGSFLLFMGAYEIYIFLIRFDLLNLFYWIITFLPSIVQTFSLCFANNLLTSFYFRLQLTKQILKSERLPYLKKKYITAIPENEKKFFKPSSNQCPEKELLSDMSSVFILFNDLLDLGCAIENFFGTIFLSSIASIFVVTTVQIYYCYVLVVTEGSEAMGYSTWTIIVSVNYIILNTVTIAYLTTICELIANQVRLFLFYYYKKLIDL